MAWKTGATVQLLIDANAQAEHSQQERKFSIIQGTCDCGYMFVPPPSTCGGDTSKWWRCFACDKWRFFPSTPSFYVDFIRVEVNGVVHETHYNELAFFAQQGTQPLNTANGQVHRNYTVRSVHVCLASGATRWFDISPPPSLRN